METDQPPSGLNRSRWTREAKFLYLMVSALLGLACFLLVRAAVPFNQDFRAFYAAGQMILHSPSHLYDLRSQQQWQSAAAGGPLALPFFHPAYEALLYAPLTLFSFRSGYLLYAVVNMALLGICYAISPADNSPFAALERRPLLFFLSFPLLLAVFVGQNSLWMLLVLSLVFPAILRGRDHAAGALLGLIAFKLAIVVPLALLLSVRRGRRFALSFALTFALCIGLSVGLTGMDATRDFLHLLAGATLASSHTVKAQVTTAVWLHSMPNLSGLMYLLGSGNLPAHVAFALNATLSVAVLGGFAWIVRGTRDEAAAYSAAIIAAVLVSPHLYLYDLAALVLPLLLLQHRMLKYVGVVWFLLPPALYLYGQLRWLAPAVVVPLALAAICIAEFRRQSSACRDVAPAEFA